MSPTIAEYMRSIGLSELASQIPYYIASKTVTEEVAFFLNHIKMLMSYKETLGDAMERLARVVMSNANNDFDLEEGYFHQKVAEKAINEIVDMRQELRRANKYNLFTCSDVFLMDELQRRGWNVHLRSPKQSKNKTKKRDIKGDK